MVLNKLLICKQLEKPLGYSFTCDTTLRTVIRFALALNEGTHHQPRFVLDHHVLVIEPRRLCQEKERAGVAGARPDGSQRDGVQQEVSPSPPTIALESLMGDRMLEY